MSLDDSKFSSGFGSHFALARGSEYGQVAAVRCWGQGGAILPKQTAQHASFDAETFNRLYEVRKADLSKQINLLDQSLHQSLTYKK